MRLDAPGRNRASHEAHPMRGRQIGREWPAPPPTPDPRGAESTGPPRSFRSPWSGRSWGGLFQRAARDRTNEVAPEFRIRLNVLHRVDGVGRRLCRRLERLGFGGRLSGPPLLRESAADAPRRRPSDPRLDDDAVDKPVCHQRHRDCKIAGAPVELVEAETGLGRK